jgi:hypothetical protein
LILDQKYAAPMGLEIVWFLFYKDSAPTALAGIVRVGFQSVVIREIRVVPKLQCRAWKKFH